MADGGAAEAHHDASRHHQARQVAIGAGGGAADEGRAVGGLEMQTSRLRLALGSFAHEHDGEASVPSLGGAPERLDGVQCAPSGIDLVGVCPQHHQRPLKASYGDRERFGQARSDEPHREVWIAAHVEDDGSCALEAFEHLVHLLGHEAVQVGVADVAGEHLEDVAVALWPCQPLFEGVVAAAR
jgi:hypothetical protein